YLKALAMARNVAHQEGKAIKQFTTGVFDLVPLDGDTRKQAPKTDPRYYYRPWKTILVRTVADGGESFYIQGDHRQTVPALYRGPLARGGRKPRRALMLTDALIEQILTRLPSLTIGVLGDLFLDRYLDIDAGLTEKSIETGLDAYQVTQVRSLPGAL